MEGVVVRGLSIDDLDQVLAIENVCFSTPWTLTSFQYEIKNSDTIFKVVVVDDHVVGFVCIRSMLDITHVMDLAVLPAMRKRGIGCVLLKEALKELRKQRPETAQVTLEVRESNMAAIRVYEKSGFKKAGSRKQYFRKPDEDAVIMSINVT